MYAFLYSQPNSSWRCLSPKASKVILSTSSFLCGPDRSLCMIFRRKSICATNIWKWSWMPKKIQIPGLSDKLFARKTRSLRSSRRKCRSWSAKWLSLKNNQRGTLKKNSRWTGWTRARCNQASRYKNARSVWTSKWHHQHNIQRAGSRFLSKWTTTSKNSWKHWDNKTFSFSKKWVPFV